jgi:hypothetical protein
VSINLFLVLTIVYFQFIGAWQSLLPNYPFGTNEPHGTLIGNDLLHIMGFINGYSDATTKVYARDVTVFNSPWRRMDDVPTLTTGITHAATVLVGTKVYLCGGYLGPHPGQHVPHCFVYDHSIAPGSGQQWSLFPQLPNNGTAGAGMIYDSTQNALFYAGGGQRINPGDVHPVDLNNTWKYSFNNPSLGWQESTPIPYKANHMSYVTHAAGGQERHFFFGGQEAEIERYGNFADNFEFFAENETWIRRASMPLARGHATSSVRQIGCGFIVAGGSLNRFSPKPASGYNRTNDVSYYDIPTNNWTSIGKLPTNGATPIVVIHPNGYMYYTNDKLSSRQIST